MNPFWWHDLKQRAHEWVEDRLPMPLKRVWCALGFWTPIDVLRYASEREAAALEREDAASRSAMPPEVLARLGDDATPEEAIKAANRGTATYVDNLKQPDGDDNDARFAWYGMLAAAAMRECEARRKREAAQIACEVAMFSADPEGMNRLAAARDAAAKDEELAVEAYDALRNWRKR